MKQLTVIAFDVSSDARRAKVVKVLEDHLVRLQRSVFDADGLDEAVLLRLRSDIEGVIDLDVDCVAYLRLCATCAGKRVVVGKRYDPPQRDEPFEVI
jgi:CRISPR-associated endonuclease Cas2